MCTYLCIYIYLTPRCLQAKLFLDQYAQWDIACFGEAGYGADFSGKSHLSPSHEFLMGSFLSINADISFQVSCFWGERGRKGRGEGWRPCHPTMPGVIFHRHEHKILFFSVKSSKVPLRRRLLTAILPLYLWAAIPDFCFLISAYSNAECNWTISRDCSFLP